VLALTRYPHAAGAWGAALLVSLVASLACAVAAALATGSLRTSFLILVVGMPFLVLQDVARYICISRRDPKGAALSDGTWVVAFALAIVVLHTVNGEFPGATASFGAWVFGAGCGAVAAAIRLHVVPHLREGVVFARRIWRHSARYVIDWAAFGATVQVGYYILGFTAGLAVVGEFRAALLLVGPINIVIMGASMILVPELTRYRRRTGNRLLTMAAAISVGLELVLLAWVAAVAVLPESVLEKLLGDAATHARPLLVWVALPMTCAMLAQGPMVCLRATGDVRRGTQASLPAAPFHLFGTAAGAAIFGGAEGALIGMAAGSIVGGVLSSFQLVQATRSAPITFDDELPAHGDHVAVKSSGPDVETV
jgi:O-antigen/teichoic acid export membrane protein